MGATIFITATDTGVGKTLLTALLLTHLRGQGVHALAMKPFCSGGLRDVQVLRKAQENELSDRQINPYYFDQPIAPLAAQRRRGRPVALKQVLGAVQSLADRCEVLLVEGAGGVLVPLGDSYTVAELIASLGCSVILVARNRLGTINHTLLSLEALRHRGVLRCTVALMTPARLDPSSATNARLIRRFALAPVFEIPYLGLNACSNRALVRHVKKLKKLLHGFFQTGIVSSAFGADARS